MKLQIPINGKYLDLYQDADIEYTFQVNDIAEIKDRQASYTDSFKVPKTPNNIQIFNGLSIPSDTSTIPYEKPLCMVKNDGFDVVNNGWLNIGSSDETYNIHIYSGLIEFFKAIENVSLGDLDLKEVDHKKELATVLASFTNPNYKYLITDYNGLTHYGVDDKIINIDYLVPSISVKYLWDKIFSTYNFTYSGEVFTKDAFTKLFMTYPKSIPLDLELIKEDSGNRVAIQETQGEHYRPLLFNSFDDFLSFKIPTTDKYKFTLGIDNNFQNTLGVPLKYFLSVNEQNKDFRDRTNNTLIAEIEAYTGETSFTLIKLLNKDDVISFFDFINIPYQTNYTSNWTIKIERIPGDVSFTESLRDLKITDFIKDVFNQLGITIFPDKYTRNLDFLTIKERVNAEVIDWTSKFGGRESESYVYESYAQKNVFSYKYNDSESDYNDASLGINNENIADEKVAFKSITYSPERDLSKFYLGSDGFRFMKVFKLYEKNNKEVDGVNTIEYKGLDKRFHFIKYEDIATTVEIGSKTFAESQIVNTLPIGNFDKLDWFTLLTDNYSAFGSIINNSRIHNINLNLNILDIINLDLGKIYYFAQEQQYYILNKLKYSESKAKGEFVLVKKLQTETEIIIPDDNFVLIISWSDGTITNRSGSDINIDIKIKTISYPPTNILNVFDWEKYNGFSWVSLGSSADPYTATLSDGINKFRLKAISEDLTVVYSNELLYKQEIVNCRSYRATMQAGSGDELIVNFIDCLGNAQQYSERGSAPGETLTIPFCAIEGSIDTNGTINDLGPC